MLGSLALQPLVRLLAAGTRRNSNLPQVEAASESIQNWGAPLGKDERILQLLNRTSFGLRPGDDELVRRMGAKRFLDQQLHPERLDDSAIEAKIAALPTLGMSTEELAEGFREFQAERRTAQQAQASQTSPALEVKVAGAAPSRSTPQGPAKRLGALDSMQSAETVIPTKRVLSELAQEEILRAVYSNRQLNELMVQFWMNHFNIFAAKGADRFLLTSFERDTVRPRAMGKFEDLLVATAESPAMLFYLDNWLSASPDAPADAPKVGPPSAAPRLFAGPRPGGLPGSIGPSPTVVRNRGSAPINKKPSKRGLNENYSRELMELHTLGVDGGYTQKDVIEVARCLTGWTIQHPMQGGGFFFNPRLHDYGQKVVLGHMIPAGHGIADGLEVLHLLAHQPVTAHFISLKLCRRFVADDPPQSVVNRASATFLKSDGDIRAVLKTILTSPEFNSQAAYRAKVKSPLELVASTFRALGVDANVSPAVVQELARMGQPMFQYQAPTGFPDRASTWINSEALLTRMNFAVMLATNRIPGTNVDIDRVVPENSGSPEALPAQLGGRLLEGTLTPQSQQAILKQLGYNGQDVDAASRPDQTHMLVALVLASPEFQRR
jgi:uncharacterized protein (DUF1800 family)